MIGREKNGLVFTTVKAETWCNVRDPGLQVVVKDYLLCFTRIRLKI